MSLGFREMSLGFKVVSSGFRVRGFRALGELGVGSRVPSPRYFVRKSVFTMKGLEC